ncbi:MAG: FAD-dependent thymidylate synthase [Chloroflexi bacterium]|nr:FAD-dependent thymidylate synthase [Chloroflexota bacterium]
MRTYTVIGVPPETQAYAVAKYSRSALSMLESIKDISSKQAGEFLTTFYFQYGHRSIADLAHVVVALEDISILAAIKVVDEPLWDGQERSTRYQSFRRSGYYRPPELAGSLGEQLYVDTCDFLFARYSALHRRLLDLLMRVTSRRFSSSSANGSVETSTGGPPELDEKRRERALRARAFDVARLLLPLGTLTSVGQIVSARTLENQISRLLSDPLPEAQHVGQAIRDACSAPAEHPLLARLTQAAERAQGVLPAELATELRESIASLRPAAAMPTLVKHCQPSSYQIETEREVRALAAPLLAELGPVDDRSAVQLAETESVADEVVATLLFRFDDAGHAYAQVQGLVERVSEETRAALIAASVRHRGPHDELLREYRAGYPIKFDLLLDLGAFRDLHRHRRCIQIIQPFTTAHSYELPAEVFAAGLGPDIAGLAGKEGLIADYVEALDRAGEAVGRLASAAPSLASYALPLAYRCRALFKMDLAEAAYIAELRTKSAGHFSYRRIAFAMFQELARVYPGLAAHVRVTNPTEEFDLLDR